MLRLTDITLPLDHPEPALREAVLARLQADPAELRSMTVFRRGFDARKKSDIQLVYTIDVELHDEPRALSRRSFHAKAEARRRYGGPPRRPGKRS